MSIQTDPLQANLNLNHNPSSSPTWWRKMVFTTSWVAGGSYSVGDSVNYNGKTYKCAVSNTASSLFETDFYAGNWDDGNPAGTLIQNIAWNKSTLPYHYFDVTGADAGKEVSQSTYSALYNVIGGAYNNCVNYNTGTQYGNPASGNFRLPDFRNTFFKNAGSNTRGAGHNASHTHSHNRASSININHKHSLALTSPASNDPNVIYYEITQTGGTNRWAWVVRSGYTKGFLNETNYSNLPSIPALNINDQGSGNTPEPNYYGTKILLKY